MKTSIKRVRLSVRKWLLETKPGRLVLLFIVPLVLLPDDLRGNGLYSRLGGVLLIAGSASAFLGWSIAKLWGAWLVFVPSPTMSDLSSAYQMLNRAELELRLAGTAMSFVAILSSAVFWWSIDKATSVISQKLVGASNPPGFNYFVLTSAATACWLGALLFVAQFAAPVYEGQGIGGLILIVQEHPWLSLVSVIVVALLWERRNFIQAQAVRQAYANSWMSIGRGVIVLLLLGGMMLGFTYLS